MAAKTLTINENLGNNDPGPSTDGQRYLVRSITERMGNGDRLPGSSVRGPTQQYVLPSVGLDLAAEMVDAVPSPLGGCLTYRILWPNDTTGRQVKVGKSCLYAYHIMNSAAAARFVKFYDCVNAPNVGQDTPIWTVGLPAGQDRLFALSEGIQFQNGIGIGATNVVTDSDTTAPTANDVVINLAYA